MRSSSVSNCTPNIPIQLPQLPPQAYGVEDRSASCQQVYVDRVPSLSTSIPSVASPSQPSQPYHTAPPVRHGSANTATLTTMEIESKPWKYQGYRAFCEFAASSGDAFVLRRFNRLNARVILSMQDEIVQYETELEMLEQKCMKAEEATERNSSMRYDPQPRRQEIIRNLRIVLQEYNEYILSYSQLRARSSAQNFQVDNVKKWFAKYPHAIDIQESEFIDTEDDLIPIIQETKSWMRLAIEKINPTVLRCLFPAKPQAHRLKHTEAVFVSNKAMDAAMTFVVVFIGLLILLGPLWALNLVSDMTDNNGSIRLGIITGCVVLFTCILASSSVGRPFEVLVGTAGYAAVLMVYMQVQNSNPTSAS